MRRKLLLFSFFLTSSLLAEEAPSQPKASFFSHAAYLTARHREANGIGYSTGYTSLDVSIFPSFCSDLRPFVDASMHLFNDGKWASNLGAGVRFPICDTSFYGVNLYWDYRDASYLQTNQLSLGLEAKRKQMLFTLNGYFPLSRNRHSYETAFEKFQGHTAYFTRKSQNGLLLGAEAALDYHFFRGQCFNAHAAVAAYYFQGAHGLNAAGGLFKAKLNFWQYGFLEGQLSYDNRFKFIKQAEIALTLPLGPRMCRPISPTCAQIELEEALLEKPERFEIPVMTKQIQRGKAYHPFTGQPLTFYFVNNKGGGTSGTIESPFPTLSQAEAASSTGDVLYIFPGNGTNSGMNTGVTLQDYQFIVGSSAPFEVKTRFGNAFIPAITSKQPTISSSSTTIALAKQNLVSGLAITGATGIGDLNSVQGFTATYNHITATNGMIFNFDFFGDLVLQNNTIIVPAEGIIFNSFFTGNCTLESNSIITGGNSITFADSSYGNFIVQNNFLSSASSTLSFNDPNVYGNCLLQNNSFIAGADAVTVASFNGRVKIQSNSIQAGGSNAIIFTSLITEECVIQNNLITASGGGSQAIVTQVLGPVFIENNQIYDGSTGMNIETLYGANSSLNRNNQIMSLANTGSNQTSFFSIGGVCNILIKNNLFINEGFDVEAFGGMTIVEFFRNSLSPTNGTQATFINDSLDPFLIMSPNLELSGLEALNQARISLTGPISFFP